MPTIDKLKVSVFTVPTDEPESDGTLTWSATTLVVVEPSAAGVTGIGFSYATGACARLIDDVLHDVLIGEDALDVTRSWSAMVRSIRNFGRPGIASMAIAAVDCALWDLKAKLLNVPLVKLLGQVTDTVSVYGSGGFTSYSDEELAGQFNHWVHEQGIPRVKMKVGEAWGSRPGRDLERVKFARKVIGESTALFVDANGGYSVKQAIRMAKEFAHYDVSWFEEPVSSDHLSSLAEVRSQTSIDVAAGEYGYDLFYFKAMCEAQAIDCLQADASRCAGISEWLRVAALAEAHGLQISGHCAQSLHVHAACAVANVRHLEYFADHARVDRLLFEGVLDPDGGVLRPDLSRPGLGLELKISDARKYRVDG
ncbi:MAG TPA: enolase C-terminal domain-like protein [Acidimicrobiales bacterium]